MKSYLLFLIVLLYINTANTSLDHFKDTTKCGQSCTTTSQCSGDCNICRKGQCVGNGGCSSYCNENASSIYCYADSNCGSCDDRDHRCKHYCYYCNTTLDCLPSCSLCIYGLCQTPGCNQYCKVNQDCKTNGCTKCFNNYCYKPDCGQLCYKSDDCKGNRNGCTKCLRNSCVKGGCGSVCNYDPECAGQGNCTSCIFNKYCGSKCGGFCETDSECAGDYTNCGKCLKGVCSPSPQCGIDCLSNAGCAGDCGRCVKGKCSKRGDCGEECSVDTDCDIDRAKCWACVGQKCTHLPS